MRTRIAVLLILFSCAALSALAKKDYSKHNKGYFCDVGIAFGCTFPKGTNPNALLEVYTTQGYQFSNTFSLGAGVSTYNTTNICGYLQLRFNLRNTTETRTSFPYISLRGGYSWSTWSGDAWGDDKGPTEELKLGWSFYTKAANLRWSVFAAPCLYQFHFIPKIGLAFEF
ncbi:MAG: hypothetical protein WCI48_06690 [Bacteroidota bacterium]|jgi:hypothetical protein